MKLYLLCNIFLLSRSVVGQYPVMPSDQPSTSTAPSETPSECPQVCCLVEVCCGEGTMWNGTLCVVGDMGYLETPTEFEICVDSVCVEAECCGPGTVLVDDPTRHALPDGSPSCICVADYGATPTLAPPVETPTDPPSTPPPTGTGVPPTPPPTGTPSSSPTVADSDPPTGGGSSPPTITPSPTLTDAPTPLPCKNTKANEEFENGDIDEHCDEDTPNCVLLPDFKNPPLDGFGNFCVKFNVKCVDINPDRAGTFTTQIDRKCTAANPVCVDEDYQNPGYEMEGEECVPCINDYSGINQRDSGCVGVPREFYCARADGEPLPFNAREAGVCHECINDAAQTGCAGTLKCANLGSPVPANWYGACFKCLYEPLSNGSDPGCNIGSPVCGDNNRGIGDSGGGGTTCYKCANDGGNTGCSLGKRCDAPPGMAGIKCI